MSYRYETLAAELAEQIRQGILPAGQRLSGVRPFAAQQGVSVSTAVAAYRKLEDQGLIEARSRSGYFVRALDFPGISAPAASRPRSRPVAVSGQQLTLQLVQATNDHRTVQLGAAVPDVEFLPTRAIERALCNAAKHYRQRAIGYSFPPGRAELRQAIAHRMASYGCTVTADEVVISNGCQESLMLALRATTKPGDVVAIESPTFYGLLQVIDSLGLKAIEIPTHPQQGISLDALQMALEQWPIAACIVVPNFSNPLGYCMSDDDKQRLVELLSRRRVPLVEDDIYGDLGFSQRRPKPCKAFDKGGWVLSCSSYSKTMSPGLRIGWLCPGRYQEQVEYLKYVTNLAAPTVAQLAVAQLLDSGQYDRHLRAVRPRFAAAVSRMITAVDHYFPSGTRITQPQGGFVIWVELPGPIDTFAISRDLLASGISIAPGQIFSATKKYRNFLRLSCACRFDAKTERALRSIAGLVQAQLGKP
ncbi:aminotransferase-like domain-containing protein [Thiosocius teredinicola]|uniref:aminotransferase-like domain-containing protein n=1 Tax=Thiosocius teredinicola TaxID=1973002 RepID=UPI000990C386